MDMNIRCVVLLVVLPVVSLSQNIADGGGDDSSLDPGSIENDAVCIFVEETLELNFTVSAALDPGTIILKSSNEMVFQLEDSPVEFTIDKETEFPMTVFVLITGKFVGIERLEAIYHAHYSDNHNAVEQGADVTIVDFVTIKVKRLPVFTQFVIQYVMMAFLIISYITMGAKSDVDVIKDKLRRPWAVLIGMVCQFAIMPSLAFAVARAFRLDPASSLGLVIFGSCPGGWLSNAFSVLLDLDFVLSLTMTFCSTFLALGMMPLNLAIYTRTFTAQNEQLKVPFLDLVVQLCLLVVPIVVGLAIVAKFPKFKVICNKLLKPVATGMVVIAMVTTLPFEYYVFIAEGKLYGAAFTMPLVGGCLGFLLAKVACLENRTALTVAIETGSQNALLAIAMVKLFYPLPEADLVSRIPLFVVIFTLMEGLAITFVYVIVKRLRMRCREQVEDAEVDSKPIATSLDVKPSGCQSSDQLSNAMEANGIQNQAFTSEGQ